MGGTERDAASWPWPPELDGPIAAPLHTHQLPTILYVLSGSHFIRRDETGATMLDTRSAVPPFEMPRVLWAPSTPAHTLENTGDDDLIVIGVELKGADIDAP